MRRYLGPLVLAVVVLVALWFMQRDNGNQAASPRPSVPSAVPAAASPPATPAPSSSSPAPTDEPEPSASSTIPEPPPVNPVEPEGEVVDPTAPAIPRDKAQAGQFTAYGDAAGAFMRAFARPAANVTEDQWWAKVKPQMTPEAATVYEGVDPRNVPFTQVTGAATIVPSDAPSELLTIARVPTDAGWYLVEMTTTEAGIRITRAAPEAAQR